MLKRMYDGQVCSVARALEIVGERWTPLIVREALFGTRRFDEFAEKLGLARNVLTERLNFLVDNGIFVRVPYQDRPRRHEYHLTAKGRDLTPVIVSLMRWGDKHLADPAGPPRLVQHVDCGGDVTSGLSCDRCDRPLDVSEVVTTPGPGAAGNRRHGPRAAD
jgi:DNA-binding HxlR family transcriptional regulator